jgi:thymidylate synthase (FAD)
MPHNMVVRVVAYTQFLGVPPEMYGETLPDDTDHGSDPARLIECAGRECYDSYRTEKHRASETYHQHIKEVGHGSVTGHATISFLISGISRNLTHELVRHGIGTAISQRSSRYCDESQSTIAWHPLLEKALEEADWSMLDGLVNSTQLAYQVLMQRCQDYLLKRGVKPLDAKKQARGAARGILPTALSTGLIWTANIRALRHVLEQRCCDAADAEIRLLMGEVYLQAKEVCPEYLDDYEYTPAADGIGFCLSTPFRKI